MARSFYTRVGVEIRDDLSGRLEMLKGPIREASKLALEAAGEVIRQRAYELANVSPGILGHGLNGAHMRDEIRVQVKETDQGAVGRVGIDLAVIPYAPHQEFGPNGKPFLRPATDETREEVRQIMRDIIATQVMEGFKIGTSIKKRNIA